MYTILYMKLLCFGLPTLTAQNPLQTECGKHMNTKVAGRPDFFAQKQAFLSPGPCADVTMLGATPYVSRPTFVCLVCQ